MSSPSPAKMKPKAASRLLLNDEEEKDERKDPGEDIRQPFAVDLAREFDMVGFKVLHEIRIGHADRLKPPGPLLHLPRARDELIGDRYVFDLALAEGVLKFAVRDDILHLFGHEIVLDEKDDEKGDQEIPDGEVGLLEERFLPASGRLLDSEEFSQVRRRFLVPFHLVYDSPKTLR